VKINSGVQELVLFMDLMIAHVNSDLNEVLLMLPISEGERNELSTLYQKTKRSQNITDGSAQEK